jgi:hypothetical protein
VVCAPPLEATSNELADWLELEVLASDSGKAPLVAVNDSQEIGEDFEPDEIDDEDIRRERRVQQVAAAIRERIDTIGNAYPFEVDPPGNTLSLKESLSEGACTYLFCLIVSHGAKDGFLVGEGPWAPDLIRARSLFQICATVGTAGFVEGPAFSTGWPRPDSSSFLEKLREAYGLFGDGVVCATVPPGAPDQVKDDEIDVIAWKHSTIRRPGTVYLLGQAASGADWDGKSLKGGPVDVFHGTWFSRQPASTPQVATIIPFVLPTDADAGDHEAQAEVEGRLRRNTLRHGIVLFRHRLAQHVDRALAIREQYASRIERIDELKLLCDYVDSYREQLRSAIASLA